MAEASHDISLLLEKVRHGDRDARMQLASIVYPELRRIAADRMRGERQNHTLQPTALVHEAFVRLFSNNRIVWQDRIHFFSVSAQLMRHILVDYARRRNSAKRGCGAEPVDLKECHIPIEERPDVILEVDRLLTRLRTMDPRQAEVVELHYFSGLTDREIAEAQGLSERTVKRDLTLARAWMRKEMAP